MANEEREIRFIDPMYNEKFRIPDGGRIRVEYPEYPDWDYTATCKYIDDYHTSINNRVFHICEFAELMERNGCVVRPEAEWAKEAEERLTEAMEVAGMHYDELDSSPDSLRFTSELGTVTYFNSWTEVNNWLDGTIFDDPEVEMEVDEILYPQKYSYEEKDQTEIIAEEGLAEDKIAEEGILEENLTEEEILNEEFLGDLDEELTEDQILGDPEKRTITVLAVEPGKEPEVRTIKTDVRSLQAQVDGYIEAIYPFKDNVGLIMNEEGKLDGLALNRALYDEEGNLYDIIAGTFLVTGLTEDGFKSLTPEQIQKYTEMYQHPQMFIRTPNGILVETIEPKERIGSFDLYQLKDSPETRSMQFESFRRLAKQGQTVNKANYLRVYGGTLYSGENLDSIYERFNLQHPSDFRGHSLSVSDVIVLHQNGQDQAFYVDSFGFQQVPEFFSDNPLKTVEELLEDDYGMIDGIINNGDRRQDSEEKKEKISVREKLQEKKKEAAEAEASRPKLPKKSKDMDVDLS